MADAGSPVSGIRLEDLAASLSLEFEGDPGLVLSGLGALDTAGPADLAFIRSASYLPVLKNSRAGAVIALPSLDVGDRPVLRAADPTLEFQRAARLIVPEPEAPVGIHASACIADDAQVDPSASIGAGCIVGRDVSIGPRSVLHPGVVLYDGARVGADCILHARSVVAAASILGDRVILHPGAVIGGDGFGFAGGEDGVRVKTHDIGRVVLEDDVEIGVNSTIDRGTLGDTRIGKGTKIDNLVMIAHNCQIGRNVLIAAQVGLAGSCVVEDGALLLGQVGVAGHLRIGKGATLAAKSGVTKDVPAGVAVFGYPHRPGDKWHKEMAAVRSLPALIKRFRLMEKRVGAPGGDDG